MNTRIKTSMLLLGIILCGSKDSFSQVKSGKSSTTSIKKSYMDTSQIIPHNKRVIINFYETILNERKLDQLAAIVSEEYINSKKEKGVKGFQASLLELIKAFPDAQWRIEDIIAEDNKVVVKQSMTGTHTGQFQFIAPTNKKVNGTGIAIYEFKEGKIVNHNVLTNQLGFLQDIEVLPQDLSKISNNENKESNKSGICFIDKFLVPESSAEEFFIRMNYNRSFLKELPGYVDGVAYDQKDDKGNHIVITTTSWDSQESLNTAKESMQSEFKRINFNPSEFYERLNIKMERGTFLKFD